MLRQLGAALAAICILTGCSRQAPPAVESAPKATPPVRITQFYTTAPQAAKGESALLCYGVENATKVWLTPPRQELSSSPSRCLEISPAATTSYSLTAEGADGKTVSETIAVSVGPGRAKIVEVRVSALQVRPGTSISICYQVRNATAVQIEPIGFRANRQQGCTVHQPQRTTTYIVTATGAAGARDQERVTVKVN